MGRFIGGRQAEKLKEAVRLLFLWGIGFGAIFAATYGLLGQRLLHVFTDQPEVIEIASVYLPWVVIFPFAGAVAFMWDGTYIGATAVRPMRNTLILATLGVFLPTYYLTRDLLGNHSLWLAMTLFMLARSVSLTVLAKRYVRVKA